MKNSNLVDLLRQTDLDIAQWRVDMAQARVDTTVELLRIQENTIKLCKGQVWIWAFLLGVCILKGLGVV